MALLTTVRLQNPKEYQTEYRIVLTDGQGGVGFLFVEGLEGRQVPVPAPPGSPSWYYQRTTTVYDKFRVVGIGLPDGYGYTFGLKRYDVGVLPSSLDGATTFTSREDAFALVAEWVEAGAPGLWLESQEETQRRHKAERSAHTYDKIARMLSGLTEEDLQRLSATSLRLIMSRAEKIEKEKARAQAKREKAIEKARLAEEKAAKKAAQITKKAEREAAKAAKAAAKAAKLVSV